MTVSFATIKSAVKRHLSIIGKRLYDKEGKNLFSNITVSSAEDPIFDQYISAGAQNIESLFRQLVTLYNVNGTTDITIVLENNRGVSEFDNRCADLITTYITLFTVGEYLSMTHPDLAEKYSRDAANAIQSLMAYAFYKEPPTGNGGSYWVLAQKAFCNYDTLSDGMGELPHMYGSNAFKLTTYESGTFSIEYSGSDTLFYYVIGAYDGGGGYTYSPESATTATLSQIAQRLVQSDDSKVVLVWLDNHSAGDTFLNVYRNESTGGGFSEVSPIARTTITQN